MIRISGNTLSDCVDVRNLASRVLVMTVVALLLSLPVGAEAKKTTPLGTVSSDAKVYGKDILTESELRKCIALEKDIKASSESLEPQGQELTQQREELEALKAEIDEARQYLDENPGPSSADQEDIDSYKNRVESYKSGVTLYNEGLDSYKEAQDSHTTRVEAHNTIVQDHAGRCADKNYYQDDYDRASQE